MSDASIAEQHCRALGKTPISASKCACKSLQGSTEACTCKPCRTVGTRELSSRGVQSSSKHGGFTFHALSSE